MSAGVLAAIWATAGILSAVMRTSLRRHRAVALVPLALAGVTLAAASADVWPGPAASSSYGATLTLGRPGLGLLVVAAVALAATLVLAPGLDGGEVAAAALVGAAAIVALSATVPVVWALAIAVGVAAISLRWIATSPDRATLSTGRVAGLGAAALVGASALLPETLGKIDSRTTIAGALLAAGVGAVLALVPLGGWAAAAVGRVRGADLAAWSLLLAPAVLLSAGAALPGLATATRGSFATDLLVLGLVSAVYSAAQAVRSEIDVRYGRVWIADLALAAAGLASLHDAGRLGGMLLVLAHLVVAPLLLNGSRPGLERPTRVAWLAVSGLPPAPAFWGRLLVLEGLAPVSGVVLGAGLAAFALVTAATVRTLVTAHLPSRGRPAGPWQRTVGWLVCLAAIAAGLAPGAVGERVFGLGFS